MGFFGGVARELSMFTPLQPLPYTMATLQFLILPASRGKVERGFSTANDIIDHKECMLEFFIYSCESLYRVI